MDLYNLVVAAKLSKGGGGDEPVLIDKSIDANGTYKASDDSADGYKKVTVSVPSSGITPTGTSNITSNGIYDVTNYASASVSVPIPSGYIQPTGTSSITQNGIYDITSFASVDVNVSGGGGGDITADQVALRTISGVISGSAVGIAVSAFTNCDITGASFPSATYISNYAFSGCNKLETAYFPSVTKIGSSAFMNCKSLETISFPNATDIYNGAFSACTKLSTARFPSVKSIAANAFNGCSQLVSLYLLGSSVASFAANALQNTPMSLSTYTGSFGSIYVPASLVDSYKASTNWSAYSARITSYVE